MSVAIAPSVADTNSPAADAFFQAIQSSLQSQLGTVLGAPVVMITPGGQGEFATALQDSNDNFNGQTYQFISGVVSPSQQVDGSADLTPSEFPGEMLSLFQQIQFQFSAADAATKSAAVAHAQQAASDLVQTYIGQYGAITDADIASAVTAGWLYPKANRFEYIVQYVVGGQWAQITKAPGLSLTEMQNAESLQALLPGAPADAGSILSGVSTYLNALGPATALIDQQSDANASLHHILSALQNPAAGTTGMTVFNADGTTSVVPAYIINKSSQQIANDLADTSRRISVQASVQQSSQSQKSVTFQGGIAISFTEGLAEFDGTMNFQGDIESLQGSGSEVDVLIDYRGWSSVPVQPAPLSITAGSVNGWYAPQLLKQAYKNYQAGAKAPSGLTFVSAPQFDLDRFPSGDFSFPSNIVITNYPTITLHYTNGDYASFSKQVSTQTSGTISILGIPIGSLGFNTYSLETSQSSSNSDFTVTLTPPVPTNVPPLQVTAYVIGAVVTSPAV